MKKRFGIGKALCVLSFSAFFMLTGADKAWAEEFTVDDITYETCENSSTDVVITNGKSLTGAVTIKSTVTYSETSYNVVGVDYAGFSGAGITSITLPNSVEGIGPESFNGCKSLTTVTLGNNVLAIESGAFGDCDKLTTINLPDSVLSIGEGAFAGCKKLVLTSLPIHVAIIEDEAFIDCDSIVSMTFGNEVTLIGARAFMDCNALKSVSINDNATIGERVFAGCDKLETVTSVKSTEADVTVTVGEGAFENATSLKKVELSDNTVSIGNDAFNVCNSLEEIKIPDGVTVIGENAFNECGNLKKVALPDNIVTVAENSFPTDCVLLYRDNTNAATVASGLTNNVSIPISGSIGSDSSYEIDPDTLKLEITGNIKASDLPASYVEVIKEIELKDTTTVADGAFSSMTGLESITFDEKVTSIADGALPNNSNLVIKGYTNSKAEEFANAKGYTFSSIGVIITFDKNGGDSVSAETVIVKNGETITTLPVAAKAGYTFSGWYTGKTDGTKVTQLTKDTVSTLYASFTKNEEATYTVEFDANGGVTPTPETMTVKESETRTDLPTTSREGYTFLGWYTAKTEGTKVTQITKDTVSILYAQWSANEVTVTLDPNEGTVSPTTVTVKTGETKVIPTPTREGYTFLGWFTAKTEGTKVDKITTSTPTTIYAQWKIQTITITFDKNEGDSVLEDSVTINYGEEKTELPTATREGYTFLGWFTAKVGGEKVTKLTKDTPLVLYAQWKQNEVVVKDVTITFDANEGTASQKTVTFKETDEVKELPTATREGYTFLGWFTAKVGGEKVTKLTKDTVTTLYAQWEKNEVVVNDVTITFDANEGTASKTTVTFKENEEVTELPTATREGYTFLGWFTAKVGGEKVTKLTKDTVTTLYAQWEKNEVVVNDVTITFDANEGTASKTTVTFKENEEVTELPTATREGYTFLGWFTAKVGGEKVTKLTKDTVTTLYAQWEKNKVVDPTPEDPTPEDPTPEDPTPSIVTVVFNANGGATPSKTKILFYDNKVITVLPTVKRTGYTFLGWYTRAVGGTRVTKLTAATSPVLYAHWRANVYKIAFAPNGGKNISVSSKSLVYGSKVGTLPKAKRTGYKFLGWYTKRVGGTKITSTLQLKKNFVVYAHWKKVTVSKTSIKSLKAGKKSVKVSYKKVSGVKGYQIRYSTKKSMSGAKKIYTTKTSKKLSSLKAKKKYYVQVRAYKLDSAGNKVYGAWCTKKAKKTK